MEFISRFKEKVYKKRPKYLVAIGDSEEGLEALKVAWAMSEMTDAEIYSAYVIEVPNRYPLDAEFPEKAVKGDQILTDVEKWLKRRGVRTHISDHALLQSRHAWHALIDMANALKADAIFLAAKGRIEYSQVDLEFNSKKVLNEAKCQVNVIKLRENIEAK